MSEGNVGDTSAEDLSALQSRLEQIKKEEEEVSRKIKEIKDAERQKVLQTVIDLVREHEIISEEIFSEKQKKKKSETTKEGDKQTSPVSGGKEYRNGDQVWYGKGRKPDWLKKIVTDGGNIEDYRVPKAD